MPGAFRKTRLDNGATLLVERVPGFQSLSVGVWVSAGTRHEAADESGISHFLEHMMFKGTERRSALDIAQAIDRVGGEFNAFTSREYTCFHILLLSRDLKLAVDIMTDVLLNSKFDADEIERERKVILQEIAMIEDNPEELIHDLFFEQAFGKHPLGKPILGDPETIKRLDRTTIVSYFRRHYAPERMIISVAGDVDPREVERFLNRYLKTDRPRATGRSGRGRGVGDPAREGRARPRVNPGARTLKRGLEQTHIVAGFPCLPNDHPDRFAAVLLNVYLGGGMSSSLFQEIREKRGLAYSVYSSLAPFSDAGLFSVYVGTSPEEAGTCLDVAGREIAKLRNKALDAKALAILRENLKGTVLLNSDSVESRMTAIAKNEMFFGKYFSLKDTCRMIESVRAEDVLRVARRTFGPGRLILTVMGPRNGDKAGRPAGAARRILRHLAD